MIRALPFAGYEELSGHPHVMVDGAARSGSVLTLSHWPQSPTPPELARDTSTEIVLAYLEAGEDLAGAAKAVTNDHFDEDGLMSIMALLDPGWALERAAVLVGIATCGDFGVVRDEQEARICFAVSPLAEALAGPGAGTSDLYRAVLEAVPVLVEHPERYEAYYRDDLEALVVGQAAIDTGEVDLAERPEVDLAVVERTGPVEALLEAGRLPGASGGVPIHAAAVNTATTASRVLAFDGDHCELYLRYEGWVRLASRAVPLRPDLAPLAAELTAEEPGSVIWQANPVGAIVGRLHPSGDCRSDLSPEHITALVVDHLGSAPPAWDPYREGGSYIPPAERWRYRRRSGVAKGRRPRGRHGGGGRSGGGLPGSRGPGTGRR